MQDSTHSCNNAIQENVKCLTKLTDYVYQTTKHCTCNTTYNMMTANKRLTIMTQTEFKTPGNVYVL